MNYAWRPHHHRFDGQGQFGGQDQQFGFRGPRAPWGDGFAGRQGGRDGFGPQWGGPRGPFGGQQFGQSPRRFDGQGQFGGQDRPFGFRGPQAPWGDGFAGRQGQRGGFGPQFGPPQGPFGGQSREPGREYAERQPGGPGNPGAAPEPRDQGRDGFQGGRGRFFRDYAQGPRSFGPDGNANRERPAFPRGFRDEQTQRPDRFSRGQFGPPPQGGRPGPQAMPPPAPAPAPAPSPAPAPAPSATPPPAPAPGAGAPEPQPRLQ